MFPASSKVLIVDDMVQIRENVRSILRNLQIPNVIEADNGQKAWDLLIEHKEKGQGMDLVISDWNMPQMTGIEFLRKVRSDPRVSAVPFILLTSESEKSQITDAVLAGVSQYIVKPFTAKAVEDKLKATWQKYNSVKS